MNKPLVYMMALLLCTPLVFAANPGHIASSISSGTFESGDYTFPNDLFVTGNLTITPSTSENYTNATLLIGRYNGSYESLRFDTSEGNNGSFVLSKPLLVPGASPAITFYDLDDPGNESRRRSIVYDANNSEILTGDSFVARFSNGSGLPPPGETFFQIGPNNIDGVVGGGQYFGFNTPAAFTGDLLKFQVGNNTRVRMTQFGDLIINSGIMTTNAPILNLRQTWNAGATQFNAIALDITDTSSAANSNLINLQVGSTPQFEVRKDGAIIANQIQLNTGMMISEFSNDVTLEDNSSSAVPTEQAVRSYVDAEVAGAVVNETQIEDSIFDADNSLDTTWAVTASGGNDFNFDSDTFYLDSSADSVGIGTNTPGYTLDVSGTARFTSDVIVENDLYVLGAITNTNVDQLFINGSLTPQSPFDNTFDLGNSTNRWRDLYVAGTGDIGTLQLSSGTSVTGISTATSLGTSNDLLATQNAIKQYVDTQVSGVTESDTLDSVTSRGSSTTNSITVASIDTGNGAKELGDAAVADGDTNSIPTSDQVYDFVIGQGYGDITEVNSGTGLSGGSTSGAATLSFDTTYGDARYYTQSVADSNFVDIDGDTMTGALILNADPSVALGAATKQYVDNQVSGAGNFDNFTIDADTGTAQTISDGNTFTITGGSGISTSVGSTDTITITASDTSATNELQNLFLNVASDSGTAVADTNTDTLTITGSGSVSTAVSGDTLTITGTDTNTQLSNEQVEDITGGMLTGNTETGITVTYQDGDGTVDFVNTGDTTPDTIADDGTITLGTETTGSYDSTPDTIADDGTITLGTETTGSYDSSPDSVSGTVDSSEITNGAIQEVDLSVTNGPTNNYFLTYDSGGGFTWVPNPDTDTDTNTQLSEATVESYIWDNDLESGSIRTSGTIQTETLSLTTGEGLYFTEDNNYFGTNADARIIQLRDGNGLSGSVDGGLIIEAYTTSDTTSQELLRIRNSQFQWKGNDIYTSANDPFNTAGEIQAVSVGGEVSGTIGSITVDNNALDDQYYDSEADLTGLLNDNYVNVGGDTMTGTLTLPNLNTGQGTTEVYLMNQDVRTTDNVNFNTVTFGNEESSSLSLNGQVMYDQSSGLWVYTTYASGVYPSAGAYRVLDTGNVRGVDNVVITDNGDPNSIDIGVNDGSGSSLDADLFDGRNSDDFIDDDGDIMNGELTMDGHNINSRAPTTGGGWARGMMFDNDVGTRWGGVGMLGSGSSTDHIYLAHGSSPWSSATGLYVESNGDVGIGTTTAANTLDVNGGIDANTLNTGLGDNELYAMNQNVRTSDAPTFTDLTLSTTTETAIRFDGDEAAITVHDSQGNFNILSGVDEDNIIRGGTGGTRIEMSDNGYVDIEILGGTDDTAASEVASFYFDDNELNIGSANLVLNSNDISNANQIDANQIYDGDDAEFEVNDNLRVVGDITLTGDLISTSADIAENFPSQIALEPGTVVSVDRSGLVYASDVAYDSRVIGIVTTDPAVVLGSKDKTSVPLALTGTVPAKVSTENGNIIPGDLLVTSNTPGHVMKCTADCKGQIVAKAMESLSEETGLIKVVVTLG